MNKRFLIFLAAMAFCIVSGTAQAAIITDAVSTFGGSDSVFLSASDLNCNNNSVTYWHNITDNGYAVGTDILSALLTLTWHDDSTQRKDGGENASLYIDLTQYWFWLASAQTVTFALTDADGIELNASAIASLERDGRINVTLEATRGDFYLDASTLTVTTNDATSAAPVPEPATLMLLGSGLLGLAGFRKKNKQ